MPVPREWRHPGADMGMRCPLQLRARFTVQFSAREGWLPLLPPGNAKGMRASVLVPALSHPAEALGELVWDF